MAKFLAVYIGLASEAEKAAAPVSPDKQHGGMNAWGAWMKQHGAQIVDGGGPLGKTKRVSPDGISDTKNNLVGYVIVEADSLDAASRIFENHPHFAIFPGDSVQVIECLEIPGM